MLLRGDINNNLRVKKQARTLVRYGWRVSVVALAVKGQYAGLESDPAGFEIMRVPDSLPLWMTPRRAVRSLIKPSRPEVAPAAAYAASAEASKKRYPRLLRVLRLLLNRITVMWRMARVIRSCRPTLIECHNVNTLPAGFLGSIFVGASVVYDAHEINTEREGYYAKIKWLIRSVERLLVPRASLVMSTTDMRSDHYQQAYRLRERPLVVQNRPPYINVSADGRLRRALGIPPERLIVLYQGGLQEGRGLHNLVRVSALVPEAAFVFLGSGAQEHSLRALAGSLGITDRVYFHQAVPLSELPYFTADANIGMQILRNTCLNHYTTDSNKVFEYGMAGLAVVASDFPEIRKILEEYQYGVLVNPENLEEIAGVIRGLVHDNEEYDRLRENARQSRRALSWESQEGFYLSAMRQAAQQSRSGL